MGWKVVSFFVLEHGEIRKRVYLTKCAIIWTRAVVFRMGLYETVAGNNQRFLEQPFSCNVIMTPNEIDQATCPTLFLLNQGWQSGHVLGHKPRPSVSC